MTETAIVGNDADFIRTLSIHGTPDALRTAVATAEGVSGWWWPTVSPGPDLLAVSFGESGLEARVDATADRVVWDVVSCSAEPDWVGTTIEFAHATDATGTTHLVFTHHGLAALPCAETCYAGWTHYLPSLVSYVESGAGNPGPK